MNILNKFKIWFNCKTSGRIKEYQEYLEQLKTIKLDINWYSRFLNEATQKFANIQKIFSEDSKQYIDAKDEMNRWQQVLDSTILSLKFIRPNSAKDIEYRNMQCEEFPKKLQEALSPNFDLRFHGTPIYFAEQIINTGVISSTADRYDGYIKSTDRKGEISVANRESIGRTINFFSDMVAYNRSLPCGCIFAILPKDKADAEYGDSLMHTVDFKQNPAQLFGIFTTPENVEQVKKWMTKSELNSELVYTFEEFLDVVKNKSIQIDEKANFSKRMEVQGIDYDIKSIEKNNNLNIEQGQEGR